MRLILTLLGRRDPSLCTSKTKKFYDFFCNTLSAEARSCPYMLLYVNLDESRGKLLHFAARCKLGRWSKFGVYIFEAPAGPAHGVVQSCGI